MKAPQVCPNPECQADLRDRTAPSTLSRRHRRQFTAAYRYRDDQLPDGTTLGATEGLWKCPRCGHEWITDLVTGREPVVASVNPAKKGLHQPHRSRRGR